MKYRFGMVAVLMTLIVDVTGSSTQENLPTSIMVRDLGTPAEFGSGEPNLVRGGDGLVYLTWIQKNPDKSHTLFFSRYDSAGWTPARPICSGRNWVVNWADFPAIAVGENGAMLASWLETGGADNDGYGVKLSYSRDHGHTWGEPFPLHGDKTDTEHGFVSLTTLPEREFAAVWLDGRQTVKPDGPMSLRAARIDAEGKIHDDQAIDPKVCDCCQTSMARCSDGRLVVAYRDRHDDEVRDIAILQHSNKGWTKPLPLHTDNWRIAGCPVNGPSLDASERTVAAAWFTMESGDSARVYVAFSSNCGARFGSPMRVDLGAALGRVDICLVDRSRACVVWLQPESSETKILMRVVSEDGRMSSPISVAKSSANRESGFPRIAFDGQRVIVAWTDTEAGSTIRAAQIALE